MKIMITDLNHVPTNPGVYQFFNNKEIIYIGKAKNLNKRVRSYFTKAIKDRKLNRLNNKLSELKPLPLTQKRKHSYLSNNLLKNINQGLISS